MQLFLEVEGVAALALPLPIDLGTALHYLYIHKIVYVQLVFQLQNLLLQLAYFLLLPIYLLLVLYAQLLSLLQLG